MEQQKDIIQAFNKLGCKCSNNGYHLYDIAKWLREIKNIDVYCTPSEFNRKQWYFNIASHNPIRDSYEKALEAGIWEAYYLINN